MSLYLQTELISVLFVLCCETIIADDNLKVIRQWTELNFKFPSARARQKAIDNGDYIPGNSLPRDIDGYYAPNDTPRIFLTIPRKGTGYPITLGTVDEEGRISAYPDYPTNDNQGQNCDRLTSVCRIAIDKCNRLWAIDNGVIGAKQYCPTQVIAYDLSTDKSIYRFKVDDSSRTPISFFLTPAVDIIEDSDCSNTFIYVADSQGPGILVIDVAKNDSWFITHRFMYPYPSYGRITVAGATFDNMNGVAIGFALSPYKQDQERTLYFHSINSVTENYVTTSVLKNKSLISDGSRKSSLSDYSDLIKIFPGRRPVQAIYEVIDDNDVLYYSQTSPPSIYCWNTKTSFKPKNFHLISVNHTTLQFGISLKIINSKRGPELWVLSNSYQKYATGTLTNDTVNFRILTGNIATLTKNSPCRVAKSCNDKRN